MRTGLAPIERAASMYGSSFAAKALPRTTRENRGVKAITTANIKLFTLGPKMAIITSARINVGNAKNISTILCTIMSVLPPRKPEVIPNAVPATVAKTTLTTPTYRDTLAP